MEKVKKVIEENKYGFIIFAFLMVYSAVISNNFCSWLVDDYAYSYLVADFSIGFCSRLLPGAICNFLFPEITKEKVSVFFIIIMTLCFFLVSMIMGRIYKTIDERYKRTLLIIYAFLLTGPATFSIYFQLLYWLDTFWLLAAVLAVLCLCKKELYAFTIPLMLFAIMCHYGAILCYVPFIAIFILLKLSYMTDKKEKTYLFVVWVILVVTSIGLALYMITNEVGNVRMTMEEMDAFLTSRGATDTEYLDYAFFRGLKTLTPEELYGDDLEGKIIFIDRSQPAFMIFIQTVIQQIQVTMALTSFTYKVHKLALIFPIIFFFFYIFIKEVINLKGKRLKQFSLLCAMGMFIITVVFGFFFSTDTTRWFSHGLIPIMGMICYMIKKDSFFAENVKTSVEKIPAQVIVIYLLIYSGTI